MVYRHLAQVMTASGVCTGHCPRGSMQLPLRLWDPAFAGGGAGGSLTKHCISQLTAYTLLLAGIYCCWIDRSH